MMGQTWPKYFVPLAGGLQAVYTAATPAAAAYWRHVDWLGSSRLASTASRTVSYDGAYAPYGQAYAEAEPPIAPSPDRRGMSSRARKASTTFCSASMHPRKAAGLCPTRQDLQPWTQPTRLTRPQSGVWPGRGQRRWQDHGTPSPTRPAPGGWPGQALGIGNTPDGSIFRAHLWPSYDSPGFTRSHFRRPPGRPMRADRKTARSRRQPRRA